MIRIGFYTPTVMFSADLPDVSIFTDQDFVDFRLSTGADVLLNERYYTYNGSATVADIASLIEQYMAGNPDLNFSEFIIEASAPTDPPPHTPSVSSTATAHSDSTTPRNGCSKTSLPSPLTGASPPTPSSSCNGSPPTAKPIAFFIYATYLDIDGNTATYRYVLSGNGMIQHGDGINREFVLLADVRAKIQAATKASTPPTLLSVTARCGERSLTLFVDPALADTLPFHYTNCFNVAEQLILPHATTHKIKADRSIATLGKSARFYNVTTAKEYEVQSAPLTSDECLQVEQMLTSPVVRIPWGTDSNLAETDFDAMLPILITDFTSELSDTDDKPNSVKFTWRFKDTRPKFNARYSPGIFDTHFQPLSLNGFGVPAPQRRRANAASRQAYGLDPFGLISLTR